MPNEVGRVDEGRLSGRGSVKAAPVGPSSLLTYLSDERALAALPSTVDEDDSGVGQRLGHPSGRAPWQDPADR